MKRRTALKALLAASTTAGCLQGSPSGSESRSNSPTATLGGIDVVEIENPPTPLPSDEPAHRFVPYRNDLPVRLDTDFEVDDLTATMTFSVTNTGSDQINFTIDWWHLWRYRKDGWETVLDSLNLLLPASLRNGDTFVSRVEFEKVRHLRTPSGTDEYTPKRTMNDLSKPQLVINDVHVTPGIYMFANLWVDSAGDGENGDLYDLATTFEIK